MNLFELNSSIRAIKEKDLDPEVLADTLESLELPRNKKLDNVANWIESNQAEINFLKEKRSQLTKLQSHLENQNKHLMEFLTTIIDDSGERSIKTDHHIFRPRNYRASTIIDDVMKLPIDYVKREEVVKPDKTKLYTDLKAGKKINGDYLKQNRKTIIN